MTRFILITPLLATLLACNSSTTSTQSSQKQTVSVAVTTVTDQWTGQNKILSGTLEALMTQTLSFTIPGRVLQTGIGEGGQVRKGQLLARLEPEDYRLAVEMAETGRFQAEDLYRRLGVVHREGNLAEKEWIEATTRLRLADIQLAQSKKRLADTYLYAPTSGVVSKKHLEVGSSVAPGSPAFELVHTDAVYATIAVPENLIASIHRGLRLKVTIPALGQTQQGPVAVINPVADPVSRTYEVKVRLANLKGTLLPGMIAETTLPLADTSPRLLIPPQAVLHTPAHEAYVFLADPERRIARKQNVRLGPLVGDRLQIVNGLRQGDVLIVEGHQKLQDGQPVQLQTL